MCVCVVAQWLDRSWEGGCTDNEGICVQRTGGEVTVGGKGRYTKASLPFLTSISS